ncbi:MAG: hypothetical protein M1826_004880 [Phylliscum demangeonii]|nr:MAG: hypothetical protein M1826_004880 [Phylliscum demangeonii]
MAVIESLFTAPRIAPETMMHPISQLVKRMHQPVNSAELERFGKGLLPASLRAYVGHRLQGDDEMMAAVKMRDAELAQF